MLTAVEQVENKNHLSVPFIDLSRQYLGLREVILEKIDEILSSGSYILGDALKDFENRVADYLNCKYVLGVANGTDALILAMKSLRIGAGDEVILPVNSFIASAAAVVSVGAKPVFCDVDLNLNIDTAKIEPLINSATKAIMPVHLTGKPCSMGVIQNLSKKYSLKIIEDAAQAIGAMQDGNHVGTLGDIGCFSLHPLKNLHVYGDGGLITTNDEDAYQRMLLMRNHGLRDRDVCLEWAMNSRLDSVQAGIAQINLSYIDHWNILRRTSAQEYSQHLQDVVNVPAETLEDYAVYHNYVIITPYRDELKAYLEKMSIETKIHYPIPLHLQPAAKSLGYKMGDFPMAEQLSKTMLSLPIYSELYAYERQAVIENILEFYKNF